MGLAVLHIVPGSLQQKLVADPNYLTTYWDQISSGDWGTVLAFAIGVFASVVLLYKGVSEGLEKINKILIIKCSKTILLTISQMKATKFK